MNDHDLLGYPYAKEMSYDSKNGLIKHNIDYFREDGVHIKETNVAILHYRYSDDDWFIYRPNARGKMAVCIEFEGRYYLLAQSPRTLDRIFSFLQVEALKGDKSKIKKWSIRYPSKNEKISDWIKDGSPSIYSHHGFTCMLSWYLNNLWLFEGPGLMPKNKEISILIENNELNRRYNDDLLEWKEQISIVNDQYKSSVKAIGNYQADGSLVINDSNSLVVIEVSY
ncbi:MAG: hypothetical protein WD512_19075, partial [Candidatus Paceibacterota bacterium]